METLSGDLGEGDKRAVGRLLRVALIGACALALVLLALLATATANTQYFQQAYGVLFWATVAVALSLLALVLEMLRRLVQRYRRGLFGTRLMARMAISFSLMTLIPVLLIYLVAVAFLGRSIESWFDVPLERALESGLTMGREALESQREDTLQKARSIALDLGDLDSSRWPEALADLRERTAVNEGAIVTGRGKIVAVAGGLSAPLVPDLPDADQLRQVRMSRLYAEFEPVADDGGNGLRLRVLVPISNGEAQLSNDYFLQVMQPVPPALAESADAIARGRAEYSQLMASRIGLKRLFSVTLTLIFFLTAFAAIAAAFLLSGWLTGPLSMLAAGTRAVAEGDYRQVKDYSGRSELGVLTQSFNAMTRQLQDAKSLVDRNRRELEQVNARLESVLSNLTAGVLVLDSDFRLVLANQGAERVLGISTFEHVDAPIAEIAPLERIAPEIRRAFTEQAEAGAASWQRQFTLDDVPVVQGGDYNLRAGRTIVARGSILPERRVGYVIVFDEITELISAQRANTWAEVARRLAHEIKNPLTPIQLSAERLMVKLAPRLADADAELLKRSATTIVNQVGALKLMVDEFREYARLPAARLEPLDLNGLVSDVIGLYQASGSGVVRPTLRLGESLPMVMGDRTQLRQLIHNLVKNAQEAIEKAPEPQVLVTTELGAGADADAVHAVRLIIRDNGPGFPNRLQGRLFEPYVTSKPRGTGLGLAIVKKIADEHGARIDTINLPAGQQSDLAAENGPEEVTTVAGAQVTITFTKLAESADTSPPDPTRDTHEHDAWPRYS
ncbi:MAG: ATP-binding protein [Burkholderiaceae bacterium]